MKDADHLSKKLQEISAEYIKGALQILALMEVESLNYLRSPITMDNGGLYLFSLLHVDGPVLNLKEAEKCEASINKLQITSKSKMTGEDLLLYCTSIIGVSKSLIASILNVSTKTLDGWLDIESN